MVNKLLIIGLLMLSNTGRAQVINWVRYEHQADIKVYFTGMKYEADVVVIQAQYKHQAKAKPGYWYWEERGVMGREYDSDRVNIFQVQYKWQADYVVFIGEYEHEIKVTTKYVNEVWEH